MHRVAIHWLRRDLRLADNPALTYACQHAEAVVLAYLHAPNEESPWAPGAASCWWLHHSLEALAQALRARQQTLVLRTGPTSAALRQLIDETGATLVTWNRLYEPAIVARDTTLKAKLQTEGIEVHSDNGALLFEPWCVQTQQAQPYKVFTPFWRVCQQRLAELPAPLPVPKKLRPTTPAPHSEPLDALRLLPTIPWAGEFTQYWQPGERGAHARLNEFTSVGTAQYAAARDFPAQKGTSRLSPHLHFGELSPRQVLAAARANESFVREVGWREFAHHVLFHFPHTSSEPFDARFASYPWEIDAAALRAWQAGRTGIPIVDAGMRELWRTGYMHNRVRMLVASLLTKNLRLHWLEGARWFWDTLVDADLANNSLGWQWTAGCGTDAAPYFRIFNPVTQGERFDSEGEYVRRWVPELARLPNKWLHQPWKVPAAVLQAADIRLGATYPQPLIDLHTSRERALAGYQSLRVGKALR